MKPWEMYKTEEISPEAQQEPSSIEPKPWEQFKTEEPSISLDIAPSEDIQTYSLDVPGTVQPEDTTTTMTLPEMEQSIQQGEDTAAIPGQVIAGMRQSVSLPLSKVVEDSLNSIGIDVGTESSENLDKINKYIKDYNDEHPDQVIHPATIGNIASQLAVPLARGTKAVVATEALLSALDGVGKTNSYDSVATDAALGAAFGYGSMKVLNMLPESVKGKLLDDGGELSKQAKLLLKLNQGRISESEAIKMLKGIPKKDQTISLAESLDLAKNYFAKAIDGNDILAAKLGARLEQRRNIIEPFVSNDVDLKQAQKTFGEMKQTITRESTGELDTTGLIKDIEPLDRLYATDPSSLGTAIRNIRADLDDPTLTAGNALDIRENINQLLRKPANKKNRKTTEVLTNLRDTLDTFINKSISPEHSALINTEIKKYRETINNKILGDIINKNTKADYAVDWAKVISDIKKEGLGSTNVQMVTPILEEFAKKFANDKYMGEVITPGGAGRNINLAGAWGRAIQGVLDFVSPVFDKSRYKGLQIQKSIKASIKNSTQPLDFVDDLVKRKVITPEQATPIKTELKQIEWKPEGKTAGD